MPAPSQPATAAVNSASGLALDLPSDSSGPARRDLPDIESITEQQSLLAQGLTGPDATLVQQDQLIENALMGDLTSNLVVLNALVICDNFASYSHRVETYSPFCERYRDLGELKRTVYGQYISGDHPFDAIERRALEGDWAARHLYLQALGSAIEVQHVNPYRDDRQWVQRRDQALRWLTELARAGHADSAGILAMTFVDHAFYHPNPVASAIFARRTFELNPDRSAYSRLMVEQQILSRLSDDELDQLYDHWFPD